MALKSGSLQCHKCQGTCHLPHQASSRRPPGFLYGARRCGAPGWRHGWRPGGRPPGPPTRKETDMKIKAAFDVALAAGFAVILTLGGPLSASAHEPRGEAEVADDDAFSGAECSDHTLRGDYAFDIHGTILTAPSPLL